MKVSALLRSLFFSPRREYIVATVLCVLLTLHYLHLLPGHMTFLWVGAVLGAIVPLIDTVNAMRRREITIEAFNFLHCSCVL